MKREPSAEMIKGANALRELYEAYVQAGFTELQALILLGTMVGTSGLGGQVKE